MIPQRFRINLTNVGGATAQTGGCHGQINVPLVILSSLETAIGGLNLIKGIVLRSGTAKQSISFPSLSLPAVRLQSKRVGV